MGNQLCRHVEGEREDRGKRNEGCQRAALVQVWLGWRAAWWIRR
jgi:hypothetical protein